MGTMGTIDTQGRLNKAFRVFNSRTKIVEENLHIRFSESTPNVVGSASDWLFDIDALIKIMNYEPIVADPKSSNDDGSKPSSDNEKKVDEDPRKENECNDQEKKDNVNITNNVTTVSSTVNTAGTNRVNAVGENISIELQFDPNMSALEYVSTFDFSRDDEHDGAVADMNNLDTTIQVSPIPTTRIHKDHPLDQVIREFFLIFIYLLPWISYDHECDGNDNLYMWYQEPSIRPASSDKEMELWVELKRMYEPDPEDQLWTLTQNYMHAPIEWKLYDLSGVHHVTAKDKEIFMLVEKDYPLRRGLALVMISYRLQVENHSQMAEDLIRKIYNIANTPRKQSD
nr:hypothetical protein [Tanacetum cinerariifolium]